VLIKVTNRCGMGCSHCCEQSTPAGEHMPEETFYQALDLTGRVEGLAWQLGCLPLVLLSGGECTEHPSIVHFIETVLARRYLPMLLTNGLWLANDELRASLLRPEWKDLRFQVTHDPRFYPTAPPRIDDPRLIYVDALTLFVPLGRGAKRKTEGVPLRQAPSSYNLRAFGHLRDENIEGAVAMLRARGMFGLSGNCTPSITHDGRVVAGESNACYQLGTVTSTNAELSQALRTMGACNRCGGETNLTAKQLRAIGVPPEEKAPA
jgi:hypothetical protein